MTEAAYRTLDSDIFTEQNKVRADPKSYIDALKAMLPNFSDKDYKEDGYVKITTLEGSAAVDAAIKYLEVAVPGKKLRRLSTDPEDENIDWKITPIIGTAALTSEDDMVTACKDHVEDTGPKGITGNKGSDDSTPETRLAKYGDYDKLIAESMAYGQITGVNVIKALLIGDGDDKRANRENIFNPDHMVVGIYSGTHKASGH